MCRGTFLVVHNAAVGRPLGNAVGERTPHIHTSRRDALPLAFCQLRSEKLIERFLLAILPEPQGLATVAKLLTTVIEFHLLAKVNLIHTQLC